MPNRYIGIYKHYFFVAVVKTTHTFEGMKGIIFLKNIEKISASSNLDNRANPQ